MTKKLYFLHIRILILHRQSLDNCISQIEGKYFTFISPEAWRALKEWINYRETSGEIIKDDRWVTRDLWDTRVAQGRGLVTKPKKLLI